MKKAEFKKHFAIYRQSQDFVKRAMDFMDNFDPETQTAQALARKDALEAAYNRFCQASSMLDSLDDDEEESGIDFGADMASFEEDYFSLKAFFASLDVPREKATSHQPSFALKLPDIKLPEFAGNLLH